MKMFRNITSNVSKITAAAVLAASTMTIGLQANAAAINYQTGFETVEGFTVPTPIPSVGTYNGWYRLDGAATTSGVPLVRIDVPGHLSSQSLHVLNQGPQDRNDPGSVTYAISPVRNLPGAANVVANSTPFVHIQWDMIVNDGASILNTSDTWCLDVYDSTSNERTASFARSAIPLVPNGAPAFANIYTADGTLPDDSNGNSPYNPVPNGLAAASSTWGTYAMDLNYVTRTYTVSLNGVQVGPARLMNVQADNGLDINFTVNGRGLDDAFFDNFAVVAVPEPTTLSVTGIAAVGLLARRRRH